MRELRFRLEAVAFRVLLVVARALPRRILLGLGAAAGTAGYVLDARHRRITHDNLAHALPELPARERRRVARRCWRHFGRITLDTLCFPRFSAENRSRIVRYEGLEHIRAAYEDGKGVILFSGHFGHWELIAMMQGFLGLPLALLARPLDNPYLESLLAGMRARSGNTVIHKRRAVRELLRALRARIGVAIMIDQDARHHGIFVPFFGRAASTTPTLAHLALRTGAAVVPTFSIPERDGTYRVVYEPRLAVADTGDLERDIEDLTRRATARLEAWVRRDPELWLWMHRRWKSRPPGEENA